MIHDEDACLPGAVTFSGIFLIRRLREVSELRFETITHAKNYAMKALVSEQKSGTWGKLKHLFQDQGLDVFMRTRECSCGMRGRAP